MVYYYKCPNDECRKKFKEPGIAYTKKGKKELVCPYCFVILPLQLKEENEDEYKQ